MQHSCILQCACKMQPFYLISVERCQCQVEEEPVQDRGGYVIEDVGEEEHGDADEDVAEEVGEPRLAHPHHDVAHVAVLDALLGVGQAPDVERRVGQHGMQEGEAEHGEEGVDDADDEQVPVVGVALDQVVVRAVDHGRADVLVHEEEEREGEPEAHGPEHGADGQLPEVDRFEDCVLGAFGLLVVVRERLDVNVCKEHPAHDTEDNHRDRERVVRQELSLSPAQERSFREICGRINQ